MLLGVLEKLHQRKGTWLQPQLADTRPPSPPGSLAPLRLWEHEHMLGRWDGSCLPWAPSCPPRHPGAVPRAAAPLEGFTVLTPLGVPHLQLRVAAGPSGDGEEGRRDTVTREGQPLLDELGSGQQHSPGSCTTQTPHDQVTQPPSRRHLVTWWEGLGLSVQPQAGLFTVPAPC